jgi:hypothetical protein
VGAHASAGAHVGAPLHVVVRRSTFNVQPSTFNLQRSTFNPARPSPRAARLILPRLAPRPKPLRSGGVTRRGRTCQCGRTCRYLPTRCRPTFNVQRATFNPSRPSPRAARLILPRLAPRPKPLRSGGVTRRGRTCQCGRTCRYLPTRCRPTFNVQRATFNPARPSPRPSPQTFEVGRSHPAWAHMPVRAHMSVPTYTLSSDVQRATCNLQPRAPLASPLAPNL